MWRELTQVRRSGDAAGFLPLEGGGQVGVCRGGGVVGKRGSDVFEGAGDAEDDVFLGGDDFLHR